MGMLKRLDSFQIVSAGAGWGHLGTGLKNEYKRTFFQQLLLAIP